MRPVEVLTQSIEPGQLPVEILVLDRFAVGDVDRREREIPETRRDQTRAHLVLTR